MLMREQENQFTHDLGVVVKLAHVR